MDQLFSLPYRPRNPKNYQPKIGMIGCGGIAKHHLEAYKKANYDVVALCDLDGEKASELREKFYPTATIFTDYHRLLAETSIDVVDVATHPAIRAKMVEDALIANKHVLSQKPFVLDLDVGQRLAELADKQNRKLAINQNGRYAPHFSYLRAAVEAGLLGELTGIHLSVHWDHGWVKGTEFEKVHHLVLYDYAIHWFDMVACLTRGQTAKRVYATAIPTSSQEVAPPLLGQAMIEFEGTQASLSFDADTRFGKQDRTFVTGTKGTIHSLGAGNQEQTLTLHVDGGSYRPTLIGKWFPDGFHGTMGELLCSIEEDRQPAIDAHSNLDSLALCFAAVESANTGKVIAPGSIRKIQT